MNAADADCILQPELFCPALRESLDRALAVPSVIIELIREAINNPSHVAHLERLDSIARLIPTGLFNNKTIQQFL